jgi:hypothetical protein
LALTALLVVTDSGFWSAALASVVVLLWQGVHKEDEARQLVANAIAHGKAPSPALNQFREAAQHVIAEAARRPKSEASEATAAPEPATTRAAPVD